MDAAPIMRVEKLDFRESAAFFTDGRSVGYLADPPKKLICFSHAVCQWCA